MSLWGEHDCCTAAEVASALSRAVNTGAGDVVVDLAEVSFLDASTLGLICYADATLRRQDRSLSVRSPSPLVWTILEVCDMGRLVEAPASSRVASRRRLRGPSVADSATVRQTNETTWLDQLRGLP